jgi:hypothetical protein
VPMPPTDQETDDKLDSKEAAYYFAQRQQEPRDCRINNDQSCSQQQRSERESAFDPGH